MKRELGRTTVPQGRGALGGVVVMALTCFGPVTPICAQSSDEGAPFLLLPVGATAVSMGRAVTALSSEESAFWNPAGLARIERSRVLVMRGDMAAGQETALSTLLARPGIGTLAVSYRLRDDGDQEYTDPNDNLLGTVTFRDHVLVFSAAASAGRRLDLGVSYKLIQARRSCRGSCGDVGSSSTGYAVDVGGQWAPLDHVPLRIGAMLANLGPRFQLANASQADALPTRLRMSAAYDVLGSITSSAVEGWLAIEVEDRPRYRGGTNLYVGGEVAAGDDNAVFLRMGYASDGALPGGARVGMGLQLDSYRLAVAKSLSRSSLDIADPLSVSLSIAW